MHSMGFVTKRLALVRGSNPPFEATHHHPLAPPNTKGGKKVDEVRHKYPS